MATFEIPDWAMAQPADAPPPPPPDPAMLREQQIADNTRAEQALNGFIAGKQAALFEAPDAFYRTQGEDAIHAAPVILDTLSRLRDDSLDGLGNDAQRDRLGTALDAHLQLARDDIARHVAEQSLAWQRGVARDRTALLAKEAAHHHNDDELIDSLGHAAATAARAHARVGAGPPGGEAEDTAAATARSSVLGAAIQARLGRGDTEGANALFAQIQDQLDPEHAAPLQGQLDAGLMMVLPYRPSSGDSDIKVEPLPYRPPMDRTSDEALMLKNLANVPEDENTPDQNSSALVPVNVTPDNAAGAAQVDPQLVQAPAVDQRAGTSPLASAKPLISENERDAAQAILDSRPVGRRGIAPVVEPLPGSPEYEAASDSLPGTIVVLPSGDKIRDDDPSIPPSNKSGTGFMMSPVTDLSAVAEAGREARKQLRGISGRRKRGL